MPDISQLGGLRQIEQIDFSKYKPVKESTFRLPPAGIYTLQAPERFPDEAFSATKNGDLQVQIDPKIVGGPFDGFQLRYIKVSAKPFERDGDTVSWYGDYLAAAGFSGVINTVDDLVNAAEGTANLLYRAKLNWEARNNKTKFKVRGMTRFPKNADGTYQSWVEDPNDLDENGKPVRLPARLVVEKFYTPTV